MSKYLFKQIGENLAVFNPQCFPTPRNNCQLAYRLGGGQVDAEKQPGVKWTTMNTAGF